MLDMKPGKAPGEDKITVDMLKTGGEEVKKALGILYNSCMIHKKNQLKLVQCNNNHLQKGKCIKLEKLSFSKFIV